MQKAAASLEDSRFCLMIIAFPLVVPVGGLVRPLTTPVGYTLLFLVIFHIVERTV
jgi:hypothetical protein